MSRRETVAIQILAACCVAFGGCLSIAGVIRWIAAGRAATLSQLRNEEHVGKSLAALGIILFGVGFLLLLKISRRVIRSQ